MIELISKGVFFNVGIDGKKFVVAKISNILINVGLNVFFLLGLKKIAEGAAIKIQAGAKVVKAIDFIDGVDQFKVKNHRAARGIWERLKSVTVPRWCMTLLKYALGVVAAYFALSLLYYKMQNAPPQHGLQQ